jgi:eukaryotic-like serine/threonine-protein kinase
MPLRLPDRYVPSDITLDTGGMSEVIVCDDLHLDRKVVVKTLASGADPRRLLDELASLQAIRSKHVVQIFDVIRDNSGDIVAIVEEYLPGCDLASIPPPTTAMDFLRLVYPIAEGIADIHAHDRVHRDIKRQNMKYDGEGCLKIFDFGLARGMQINPHTMEEIGTPGYMAPELFQTTPSGMVSFTSAVDTFAFAATALALVKGRLPRQLRQMPPRLPCAEADFTSLPLSLPVEVADILNRCFDAIPDNRPTMLSVAELIGLHLLRDQHRALLVSRGNVYTVDKNTRIVRISAAGRGSMTITYDGLRFIVSNLSGAVAINNMSLSEGDPLPGSCVIVLGSNEQGTSRTMITVDVSHPEATI